jgi:hypothetical protein
MLIENAIQIKNAVEVKTFELYDKGIKRPSKSRETVPSAVRMFCSFKP